MNDAAVREIWARLERLEGRVDRMHYDLLRVEGRIRARLKEEAEARKTSYLFERMTPFGPFGGMG